jgi:hypothetical protein
MNVRSTSRAMRVAIPCAGWFAAWTLFGLVLFAQDFAVSQRATPAEDWRPLLFCWLIQAYVWALLSMAVRSICLPATCRGAKDCCGVCI